jgi:hypothetical protein
MGEGTALMVERIEMSDWWNATGHIERYCYAASRLLRNETVNDIACGIGYGALFLLYQASTYQGYDRPGIAIPTFPGQFHSADIDNPQWSPNVADVTICFETLEHVEDPAQFAKVIAETSRRAIIVSVPIIPTKHINPYHKHDFVASDIPPLFPDFRIIDEWEQPSESSHVWTFERV